MLKPIAIKDVIENIIVAAVHEVNEKPKIERVIFNKPATVVFFSDGTKTVAKCNACHKFRYSDGTHYCSTSVGCMFKPHVGLAVACAKKAVPNWRDEMHKWAGEE